MESALIVLVVVLAVALLAVTVLLSRAVFNMSNRVKGLDKRIEGLILRVESQEAELKRLRVLAETVPSDPLMEIWDTVAGWKKNGPVRSLMTLGTRLFKSYSKQRKLKALPSNIVK